MARRQQRLKDSHSYEYKQRKSTNKEDVNPLLRNRILPQAATASPIEHMSLTAMSWRKAFLSFFSTFYARDETTTSFLISLVTAKYHEF